MITRISKHKWFILSLILSILLMFLRFGNGDIQQDNYIGYAKALPASIDSISFYESRLLPGLPILIYLLNFVTKNFFLAGYLVTIIAFIGSYYLLYKLTRSKLSFLPLVFPPILLNLASLIDTEFPFIFLVLFAYFLIKKREIPLAFLIIGISVWFRLAGIAILAGVFIYMTFRKEIGKFLLNLPFFMFPVVMLIIFNVCLFGSQNPFYQIFAYEALHPGRISLGIFQLGYDLVRALRWHWYRIFFSGLLYIIFYFVFWFKSIQIKSLKFWLITGIYFFTLAINLVPFLENIGRYLAPTVPIFWLIFCEKYKSKFLALSLLVVSVIIVLI